MVDKLKARSTQGWGVLCMVCLAVCQSQAGMAKELLPAKEQESTEIGSTSSPSFDFQEKGVPQSLFTWIKMAKGFEVEWDTFGRKGWYTQDPRLKPIGPSSIFTPEVPAIYIVFEVAPLEDPAQFAVQWYREQSDDHLNENPLGKDVLEVPGHERYGYLELKRSGERWAVGNYLAKIYITPLGQQPFHAVNQVGTMRFMVIDDASGMSRGNKLMR
ncbi:MAG: hypothetical protein Nkreftii_002481 [Candidatus Nitrospira kreftii]|uniref:Uncharacterized protein n=1 Tax=Candidatus Nitrospira kreftii TaxID=2652173 RepID=A0A7S8FF18_9BACT|nr:MAG: hypothetical protein Nkreftii_002481 [Candidatus Nitrospira kreftii]